MSVHEGGVFWKIEADRNAEENVDESVDNRCVFLQSQTSNARQYSTIPHCETAVGFSVTIEEVAPGNQEVTTLDFKLQTAGKQTSSA